MFMMGRKLLAALWLVWLFAGCGGSSSGDVEEGEACASPDDCSGDLVCYESVCTDPANVPQDNDDLVRSALLEETDLDASRAYEFPLVATKGGETVVYVLETGGQTNGLKAFFPSDGEWTDIEGDGFTPGVDQVVAGDKEILWNSGAKELSRFAWLDRTFKTFETEHQMIPGLCIRKKPDSAAQTREAIFISDNSKIHMIDLDSFDEDETVDLDDPESDDKRDLGALAFACDVEEKVAVIFGKDGRVYSMDLSTDDFEPVVLDSGLNLVDGGNLAEVDQLQVSYPWAAWMDRRGDIWGIDLESGSGAVKLAVPDPETSGIVRVDDMRLSPASGGQGPFITWTSNLGGSVDVYLQDLSTRSGESDVRKIHLLGQERWPLISPLDSENELIWCGRENESGLYRIYRASLANP